MIKIDLQIKGDQQIFLLGCLALFFQGVGGMCNILCTLNGEMCEIGFYPFYAQYYIPYLQTLSKSNFSRGYNYNWVI